MVVAAVAAAVWDSNLEGGEVGGEEGDRSEMSKLYLKRRDGEGVESVSVKGVQSWS